MQPPRDNEWQTLALNPATDIPLYRSPRNVPAGNARLHRGTDLFAHKAPGTRIYFYLWHWSMCDNETNVCQLTTADSAKHYIREQVREMVRAGDQAHGMQTSGICGSDLVTGLEHENLMEYLPGLYWNVDTEHEV